MPRPSSRDRFRAEAQAIARLRHPNIIAIHAIGEHDKRPYLSLEFAEGGSLAPAIGRRADGAPPGGPTGRNARPRDPCGPPGRRRPPRLEAQQRPPDRGGGSSRSAISAWPSSWTPTRHARSPARCWARPVTWPPSRRRAARSASAPPPTSTLSGAILYQGLTGRPPFLGESQLETLKLVAINDVVPPRSLRPNIPRDLETICLKCLEKDPARRYASAEDLAEDLRRSQEGRPIQARRTTSWSGSRDGVAVIPGWRRPA